MRNLFWASVPFLYSVKTENQKFSFSVFKGMDFKLTFTLNC